MECADVLEMADEMTEENVQMMIEVGDRKNSGSVDVYDFMHLMHEIGIIKQD